MSRKYGLWVLFLALVISVAGCASPPKAEVDGAKTAVDKAATDGADQYAPESLKAAQDAQAALDTEMKAQEGKWMASYTKATELATAAKAAGEKASADAVAGKEKAKTDATAAIDEAKTMVADAEALLAKAPKGKGSAADIEAMKTDLATATTAITDAESAVGTGRFIDAKAKAESAKAAATTVKTAVETAMAAKKK
jgi:hypothetical protein